MSGIGVCQNKRHSSSFSCLSFAASSHENAEGAKRAATRAHETLSSDRSPKLLRKRLLYMVKKPLNKSLLSKLLHWQVRRAGSTWRGISMEPATAQRQLR